MSYDSLDSERNEWGVIHCISSEGEAEVRVLRLRVNGVPGGVGKKQIKTALERAGRVFGEGDFLWGNHRILPDDEWLDLEQAAAEAITYTDLLDEAKGEKRVTVRFPVGLHNALVKAARGKSFNQFCVDVTAAAIGYEQEPLAPALPRLAQTLGISEAEMTGRLQQMAVGSQPMLSSPFVQKFGKYLANIASLPPEQQKKRLAARMSAQDYHREMQATADLSEEQLAEIAGTLGLSMDEVRQRMEKVRALPIEFIEQGVEQSRQATPEQVKDMNLMLRDVFNGTISAVVPEYGTPEAEPERHTS